MKRFGVAGQLSALVAAFVLAMAASAGGLSYVAHHNKSIARTRTDETQSQNRALYSLIAAFSRMQDGIQRVVREKDPDIIEKLIAEGKSLRAESENRIREAHAANTDVESSFRALMAANEKTLGLVLQSQGVLAQQSLIEDASPAFQGVIGAVLLYQEKESKEREEAATAVEHRNATIEMAIYGFIGAVIAALVLLSTLSVRRISSSLSAAVEELTHSSDEMVAASAQISQAAQEVAQGSNEQASALEQTSSSMARISSVVQSNASSSGSAAELMGGAAIHVEEANRRLDQLTRAMSEIEESGTNISRIIRVIEEIAFQTNILALNAAVEAARAGEAGLGFAVVADEVRTLAQRCAQAARDTTSLIEESVTKSSEGAIRVNKVSVSVRSITDSDSRAKVLVDDVSRKSQEQAEGVEQVARALSRMGQVTQRNSANSEESAAAAQQLNAHAASLAAVIGDLKVLVGGRTE